MRPCVVLNVLSCVPATITSSSSSSHCCPAPSQFPAQDFLPRRVLPRRHPLLSRMGPSSQQRQHVRPPHARIHQIFFLHFQLYSTRLLCWCHFATVFSPAHDVAGAAAPVQLRSFSTTPPVKANGTTSAPSPPPKSFEQSSRHVFHSVRSDTSIALLVRACRSVLCCVSSTTSLWG